MPAPQSLRGVIFDLDGTLIDTADEFVVAVHRLRVSHQLPPLPDNQVRSTVSDGARALVTLALGLWEGDDGFEQERLRLLDYYTEVLGSVANPFPGIKTLLSELGNRGVPWGIATNKPRLYTDPLLSALDLQPAPASVICPDDVSRTKPDPEGLLINCREMGCAPEQAVYIGDHQRDIEAGIRAGICTVAASYGYILAGDNPADWGADFEVNSGAALTELLLSWL